METLNTPNLAAVAREIQQQAQGTISNKSAHPRINEDYKTQVSEEMEG